MACSGNSVSPTRYSTTAMTLHWLIATLIICGFALGWVMTDIPNFPPIKGQYYTWHKWIGVTIFALAIFRILWRITHPAPPLPSTLAFWQRCISYCTHALLYLLMVAIPLSGYLMSAAYGKSVVYLNLIPLPSLIAPNEALGSIFNTTHVYLNYLLLGLVILHVLAALKHQFIDHDNLIARILPLSKKSYLPKPPSLH